MKNVIIQDLIIGPEGPLTIFSGPCVIENENHCLKAAEFLKNLFEEHGVQLIFKSSYDKANRTSYRSFRGPGLEEGLRILQRVRNDIGLPVVTDVHSPEEAKAAGEVCEMLQVPAFLCRQTDLVVAVALTGAAISVKKGQFLAPWDMKNVVDKIVSAGNERIILIERGTTFGYNNLVCDMRSIPLMQRLGYPVCFDATHAIMTPGGLGELSGGDRELVPYLSKAALGAGADCLFLESHPSPEEAKSDAQAVMSFKDLEMWLPQFKELYNLVRQQSASVKQPVLS